VLRRSDTGGTVATSQSDLHLGLDGDSPQELEINWPTGGME